MLAACDAALIIGDNALSGSGAVKAASDGATDGAVEKIDLGEIWTQTTGLAVRLRVLGRAGTAACRRAMSRRSQGARDDGLQHTDEIAREYFGELARASGDGRPLSAG